jgi:hypothetical protein
MHGSGSFYQQAKEEEKPMHCFKEPDPLVKGTDPRIRIRIPDSYQNVTDPEHCFIVETKNTQKETIILVHFSCDMANLQNNIVFKSHGNY